MIDILKVTSCRAVLLLLFYPCTMCMWQSVSKKFKFSHRACLCQSAYSCPASYTREWLSVFIHCTLNWSLPSIFSSPRTFVVNTVIRTHSMQNLYLNYIFMCIDRRGESELFKFSSRLSVSECRFVSLLDSRPVYNIYRYTYIQTWYEPIQFPHSSLYHFSPINMHSPVHTIRVEN